MPKFVLIDHSICGVGGHYYEYARHVLGAAEELGYEPILVANERLRPDQSIPWRVHAVYKCGFWANLARPKWFDRLVAGRTWLRNCYLCWRTRLHYSRASLLWQMRRQPGRYLRSQTVTTKFRISWLPLIAAALAARCLTAIIAMGRDMMPMRGYLGRVWGAASRFARGVGGTLGRVFSRGGWVWNAAATRYRLRQFTKGTLKLWNLEPLSSGDIVLLPTMSEVELAGLAAALRSSPALSLPHWHLIFRRNLFPGRQRIPFSQSPELTAARGVFQSCHDLCRSGVFTFYTDTEELTEQYSLTSGVPFETLPIPHTQAPRPFDQNGGPVRISYLGDARTEKGYQHLPRIVGDLWRDHVCRGKAAFVIQSNYNIPSGEPAAIVARSQLRQYVSPNISILESPLDSDAYWDLLHSSGIVLVPYDRDNYFARSSGILAESLAAGVPVLVPAGTWMSRQIIDAVYRHRLFLRDQMHVSSSLAASELKPRVERCPKAIVSKGDEWWIGGGPRWTNCDVRADDSRLMLVSLSLQGNAADELLDVRVLQYAADRLLVSKSFHLMEQHRETSRAALLIRLHPRAERLRLGLRNAIDNRRLVVSDVRLDFLAARAATRQIPSGSVGLVYRSIEDIPELLSEMVDQIAHYRASAREFSQEWLRRHNASNLVDALQPMAEVPETIPLVTEDLSMNRARRHAA